MKLLISFIAFFAVTLVSFYYFPDMPAPVGIILIVINFFYIIELIKRGLEKIEPPYF